MEDIVVYNSAVAAIRHAALAVHVVALLTRLAQLFNQPEVAPDIANRARGRRRRFWLGHVLRRARHVRPEQAEDLNRKLIFQILYRHVVGISSTLGAPQRPRGFSLLDEEIVSRHRDYLNLDPIQWADFYRRHFAPVLHIQPRLHLAGTFHLPHRVQLYVSQYFELLVSSVLDRVPAHVQAYIEGMVHVVNSLRTAFANWHTQHEKGLYLVMLKALDTELSKHLRTVLMLHSRLPSSDRYIKGIESVPLVYFELYRELRLLWEQMTNSVPAADVPLFQLHSYYRWHEWAVNAFFSNRETAFQDYVRSIVRNDTARPYEGNLYSFSVVQIFTALSDLVHFWQELQWPDAEASDEFYMLRLARICCTSIKTYADAINAAWSCSPLLRTQALNNLVETVARVDELTNYMHVPEAEKAHLARAREAIGFRALVPRPYQPARWLADVKAHTNGIIAELSRDKIKLQEAVRLVRGSARRFRGEHPEALLPEMFTAKLKALLPTGQDADPRAQEPICRVYVDCIRDELRNIRAKGKSFFRTWFFRGRLSPAILADRFSVAVRMECLRVFSAHMAEEKVNEILLA